MRPTKASEVRRGGRRHTSAQTVRSRWLVVSASGAAAALAMSAPKRAFAQDAIWNGGAGNWNTSSNWSTGVVPNSGTTSVFIDNGKEAGKVDIGK